MIQTGITKKPRLTCMVPVGGVECRVETTLNVYGCTAAQHMLRKVLCEGTHLVVEVVEGECVIVPKPVIQGYRNFAEIILLEHVLVPDNQFYDSKLLREGRIDREIKRSILRVVDRVDVSLCDRCLLPIAEDRDDDKSANHSRKETRSRSG